MVTALTAWWFQLWPFYGYSCNLTSALNLLNLLIVTAVSVWWLVLSLLDSYSCLCSMVTVWWLHRSLFDGYSCHCLIVTTVSVRWLQLSLFDGYSCHCLMVTAVSVWRWELNNRRLTVRWDRTWHDLVMRTDQHIVVLIRRPDCAHGIEV